MPSERFSNTTVDGPSAEPLHSSPPAQSKTCQECHTPLSSGNIDPVAAVIPQSMGTYSMGDGNDSPLFCLRCREQRLVETSREFAGRGTLSSSMQPLASRNIEIPRHALPRTESKAMLIDERLIDMSPAVSSTDNAYEVDRRYTPQFSSHPRSTAISIPPSKSRIIAPILQDTTLVQSLGTSSFSPKSSIHPRIQSPVYGDQRQRYQHNSDEDYPDPLADVTRLRVRSKGYKCLFPGAIFQGTQKSGRSSYDVQVTIVDVDFSASFLCGYLRIRGLTEDWPELTTYFDAQIIGNRYGFLTQDWGASKEEDKVHWSRFPAFRAVKDELQEPRLTLKNNDKRPAVFMRWKERFLVPDHKVQDINGASFAGFYYVCVDFEPQSSSSSTLSEQDVPIPIGNSVKSEPQSDQVSEALGQQHATSRIPIRSQSRSHDSPAATMCGFYYHQNSEPYQQLSLSHVEERFTSSFEFR